MVRTLAIHHVQTLAVCHIFQVETTTEGPGVRLLQLDQASSGPGEKRLEGCMQGGLSPIRASYLVQNGEQLLVWYDGQITRMLGLQEFGALNHENHGTPMKRLKYGTNFHSLARDLEQERTEQSNEEKTVLLEKTNNLNETNKQEELLVGMTSECKGTVWRKVKAELLEQKRSAFTEVCRARSLHGAGDRRLDLAGSAFSPVPGRLGNKMNTAFKSGKCFRVSAPLFDVTGVKGTHAHNDFLTPHEYLTLPNSLVILPLPEVWPKSETLHPPQVLPPTFTALGSTAQIWCAKCKLSFRMTSDLVLHMRSRHKKEAGVEIQGKRPRELQLACPVCYAYFRERHHLSRHMTSHC